MKEISKLTKFVLDQLGISGNFFFGEFSTYYKNGIEYACLDNINSNEVLLLLMVWQESGHTY